MVGDEHLVADARPEARRLTSLGGEACQRPVPTVQPEPRLRPAAEGDQPDTEVVALGLGVLGDESRRAEGLEEPMCRAHRQTATRCEGRDTEIFSFRFEQAEHPQRPVDRLSAGATDSLR